MPEIKHTFTGGRMNKDLDERLVPNGEYRDALNVQVSTSEGSDVGTVQNILSNNGIQILGLNLPPEAFTVSSIADEKNDILYWFIWTKNVDYIISYVAGSPGASVIFRDVNKNVLKFDPRFIITGINIIDDMIFWTDNKSEPKKINISRSIIGTPSSTPGIHTKLVDINQAITGRDIEEKHVTVIKKTPRIPLEMKLETSRDPNKIYTGVTTVSASPGFNFNTVSTLAGNDIIEIPLISAIDPSGQEITSPTFGLINDSNGLTGWHQFDPPDYSITPNPEWTGNILVGTCVVIKPYSKDGTPPGLPVTDYVLKGIIEDYYPGSISTDYIPGKDFVPEQLAVDAVPASGPFLEQDEIFEQAQIEEGWKQDCPAGAPFWCDPGEPCNIGQIAAMIANFLGTYPCKWESFSPYVAPVPYSAAVPYDAGSPEVLYAPAQDAVPPIPANPAAPDPNTTLTDTIKVRITSIIGVPPLPNYSKGEAELKYVVDLCDDNEKLFEFKFPRFSYRYKYDDGEYSPFAPFTQVAFVPGSFDYHPRKGYNIGMTNRLTKVKLGGFIHDDMPKDVVSVDILFKDEASPNIYVVDTIRPDDNPLVGTKNYWDKIKGDIPNGVPSGYYIIDRETVNSVVASNQLLRPWDNVPRKALAQDVTGNRIVYGNYLQNYNLLAPNGKKYVASFVKSWAEFPKALSQTSKSIKSLREYQLGVVFTDKYGRETPVISNQTGTLKLAKDRADKNNRIQVRLNNQTNPPLADLTHFKFFVKETANEYYNLAMDRWYDAEDGNVWVAFPSSDRNKIDIDTFLILKKGSDKDTLVSQAARYKIIAIENEAPDFIKTSQARISKKVHNATDSNDLTTVFAAEASKPIPLKGESSFQIFFKPYYGTSGQHLEDLESDETLYVSFGKIGTDEISKRYKVSKIINSWVGSESIAGGTSDYAANLLDAEGDPARYSIELSEPMGDDVSFIGNDPEGVDTTNIDDGGEIQFWLYKTENLPQFDGRFFVKIAFDDIFAKNVVSVADSKEYRVTQSRKIYSMTGENGEFVNKHTRDVDYFLTEGKAFELGNPSVEEVEELVKEHLDWFQHETGGPPGGTFAYSDLPTGTAAHSRTGMWDMTPLQDFYGYYLDNRFSSFALYFRRYARGDSSLHSSAEALGIAGVGNVLLHLTEGFNVNPESTAPMANYSPTTYLDESWVPIDNGLEFHGSDAFGKGIDSLYPSNGYGGYTSHWAMGACTTGWAAHDKPNGINQYNWGLENTDHVLFDRPKETEVWFVDEGPVFGEAQGNQHKLGQGYLDGPSWEDVTHGSTINAGHDMYSDPIHQTGIVSDPGEWSMSLGYGGITRKKEIDPTATVFGDSFFNIGDWNHLDPDNVNTSYGDGYSELVSNFNSAQTFRFREDPTNTVYTIGDASSGQGKNQYIRHSTGRPIRTSPGVGPKEKSSAFPDLKDLYDGNDTASSMAENLSFNFTKGWEISGITPPIAWNPYNKGVILNGKEIELASVSENLDAGNPTCTGVNLDDDLKIFVASIDALDAAGNTFTLHKGMALSKYSRGDGTEAKLNTSTHLGAAANEFLVVRHIVDKDTYFELWLGGYEAPMKTNREHLMASDITKTPKNNTNYTFVQVGMNSYSDNSEFNINTMGPDQSVGMVGAVGYHLDFLSEMQPENLLSENPAIWETEPKDSKDLEIYYEATGAIPMVIKSDNIHSAIPVGSTITYNSKTTFGTGLYVVKGYSGADIIVNSTWDPSVDPVDPTTISNPFSSYIVTRPDGLEFMIWIIAVAADMLTITIHTQIHSTHFFLPWHNCYSFGNGVESDRIRDNFNLPYIENGVKVSTTLDQEYKEEHRKYGLIYSGLYNSTSGINNLNQFIQAEKITKDINPIYGSIQKLHSRDSDLVTLCEDKCLRILANKDAVYNADGNTNLTATGNVLGQTIPFGGEYGISTNPESFASQSYRVYFTDRVRGSVMRLSKDGLTAISNHGMKDWFKDNLKISNRIFGSYDDKKEEYNVTLKQVGFLVDDGISSSTSTALIEFETWDGTTIKCFACNDGVVQSQTFNINIGMGCPSNWITTANPCGVIGCTSQIAWNYDPLATIDDGGCILYEYGCMDDGTDDSYPGRPYQFSGAALNYVGGQISTLPQAVDDGSCCYVSGCTSVSASNYDPLACVSDDSCVYLDDPTGEA